MDCFRRFCKENRYEESSGKKDSGSDDEEKSVKIVATGKSAEIKLTVEGDVSNLIVGNHNAMHVQPSAEYKRCSDSSSEESRSEINSKDNDNQDVEKEKIVKASVEKKDSSLDNQEMPYKISNATPDDNGCRITKEKKVGKADLNLKTNSLDPDANSDVKVRNKIKEPQLGANEKKKQIIRCCEDFRNRYENILSARPVYRLDKGHNFPIILAESLTKDTSNLPENYEGLPIKYITQEEISNEAKDIFCKEKEIEDSEKKRLLSVMRDNLKMLFKKYSFINIVSLSSLKSSGYGTSNAEIHETHCIVIYCQIKGYIPYGEDPFPTQLNGVDVDVREGFFKQFMLSFGDAQQADSSCSKIRVGDKIIIGNKSGSLGPFYRNGDGGLYALTAGHVFVTDEEIVRFKITPDLRDHLRKNPCKVLHYPSNKFIGITKDFVITPGNPEGMPGIDVGILQLDSSDEEVDGGLFLKQSVENLERAGYNLYNPPAYNGRVEYDINEWKYRVLYSSGPETGLTYGMLMHDGLQIKKAFNICSEGVDLYTLYNQMEIRPSFSFETKKMQPFAEAGDSGSLVCYRDSEGLVGIGLLTGGTSYGSCIMTPLHGISQLIGFDLRNKNPFLSFKSDLNQEQNNPMTYDLNQEQNNPKTYSPPNNFYFYAGKTFGRSLNELKNTSSKSDPSEAHKIVKSATDTLCTIFTKAVDSNQEMAGSDQLLKKHAMDKNSDMHKNTTSSMTEMVVAFLNSNSEKSEGSKNNDCS